VSALILLWNRTSLEQSLFFLGYEQTKVTSLSNKSFERKEDICGGEENRRSKVTAL